MARSHARIQVAIWRNDGWLELSPKAKLTYLTLLSQPRLNLIGAIDLAERRWAGLIGCTSGVLDAALDELEAARFVVVDRETDELLIRTFVAHDLDPNRVNKNLAAGLWGAWGMLASPVLRSIAVHEMPETHWSRLEGFAPPDALQTRRSPRLEPKAAPRLEPETQVRSQPPLSSHHPPVTTRQPETARNHDTSSTGNRPELRPIHEVISHEPAEDPTEALAQLAAIRSEHQFLTKPQGAA